MQISIEEQKTDDTRNKLAYMFIEDWCYELMENQEKVLEIMPEIEWFRLIVKLFQYLQRKYNSKSKEEEEKELEEQEKEIYSMIEALKGS